MIELERAWSERTPSPVGHGTVRLICQRQGDGVHHLPRQVVIDVESGVVGDRWSLSPSPNRDAQVTLMNVQVATLIAGTRAPIDGVGDNFLVDLDLSEGAAPVGSRIRIGSALLEVTAKPHRGCAKFRQRFGEDAYAWVAEGSNAEGRWPTRRLRGVNCRVLEGGEVALADEVRVVAPCDYPMSWLGMNSRATAVSSRTTLPRKGAALAMAVAEGSVGPSSALVKAARGRREGLPYK